MHRPRDPLYRIALALSFWCENWNRFDAHNEVLGMAMAAIPLDGLVTLITHDFQSPPFEQFWLPNLPRLPLLQHVQLAPIVATRFIDWLQADNEGLEDPRLPSLNELVVVDAHFHAWIRPLANSC